MRVLLFSFFAYSTLLYATEYLSFLPNTPNKTSVAMEPFLNIPFKSVFTYSPTQRQEQN